MVEAMKHASFSFLLATLLLCFQSSLSAQELETGYFLGGNPYAFRLNPAFQSERSIFSLALGQTGLGAWSNLGVSTLLYPDASNGSVYTFMNDQVNPAVFLSKIRKRNSVDLDALVNLMTVGFWAGERFMTLDFNIRSLNAVSAPYDLFALLKEGTESQNSFDLSGTGFRSKSFVEAAFGWSKNYGNVFNVGFRIKGLVGILEMEAIARNMRLSMSDERWEIQAKSVLNASSPSLKAVWDGGYLSSVEMAEGKYGPAGFGAGVDLGVSWNVLPLLTVSASVLDVGGILWNREIRGISPETSYAWAPSESGNASGGTDSWDAEIDEASEMLSNLFKFKEASVTGGAFEMLPFRVNLGAEFRMPFYDRLSVGALYQGRGGATFARHAGRFSLNWNPLSWMSLSTGTTLSRLGESFGFALNLHPAGINLMVGCDYLPFHVVSIAPLIEDLPAKYRSYAVLPRDQMKLNFHIGLNLAFGRSHLDHAKRYVPAPVKPTPEPDVNNDQDSVDPEGTPVVREVSAETL